VAGGEGFGQGVDVSDIWPRTINEIPIDKWDDFDKRTLIRAASSEGIAVGLELAVEMLQGDVDKIVRNMLELAGAHREMARRALANEPLVKDGISLSGNPDELVWKWTPSGWDRVAYKDRGSNSTVFPGEEKPRMVDWIAERDRLMRIGAKNLA
jgi:hypothetical protein